MKRTTLISALVAAPAVIAPSAQAAKDDLLLVSAPLAAPFALDAGSSEPSVSRDGRYVAFRSGATSLVPGDGTAKTTSSSRTSPPGKSSWSAAPATARSATRTPPDPRSRPTGAR